ncbi:hypothetical protein [Alicyclobacillus macrosporangiidus]|uniref:hypothetical protein n=1 Tax=Alicyclobacillus macrosporangiidus TaxID=392015 RepID=UPI0004950FFA|nr:hypothetical protein [Alicyclobacillus macrosporangiidus]
MAGETIRTKSVKTFFEKVLKEYELVKERTQRGEFDLGYQAALAWVLHAAYVEWGEEVVDDDMRMKTYPTLRS